MGALSKGCGTCKRRKVKCDERRPKCARCVNAGVDCTGFTTRIRFVDENPRIRRSAAVSDAQSHELSTITRISHLTFHSSKIRQTQLLSPAPFLANTLPLTAFKDDIFISYLVSRYFGGENTSPFSVTTASPCGLPKEWTTELINTAQKPRHKSWNALAAIVFGKAHGNYEVITHAIGRYGQALLELRTQLSNPSKRYATSTVASITALYIYEILVSKTINGWMLHANGLGGILLWKGPRLRKSYAWNTIFLEHRITLIAKAIMSGQSTFLHSAVWKTAPWEDNPASKSAMDFLVDIGADISEYMAQIKTYSISNTTKELGYMQIRTQVAISLGQLNAWWREWEGEHAHAAVKVPSYLVNNDHLFPTLLEYDKLWTAYQICIYNAIRILLLRLWHVLQIFPHSDPNTSPSVVLDMPNQTALLGITSDIKGLGCEILRSLRYCYLKSRRFIVTSSFFFIREVAYGCFDQDSKEANWLAAHGWAEFANLNDVEDANLVKTLSFSNKLKLEELIATNFRDAQVFGTN